MYTDEINGILTNFIGKDYYGCYPIDSLPSFIDTNGSIIVNTHSRELPGEHWIAVHRTGKLFNVFDPLGFYYPSKLMAYLHERGRVKYSTENHQPIDSKLCGNFCILWLLKQYHI